MYTLPEACSRLKIRADTGGKAKAKWFLVRHEAAFFPHLARLRQSEEVALTVFKPG